MHRSKSDCYSITLSARTRSDAGTENPRAFAVLRLRAVSYFVGDCTGRSAGLAPRKIWSMYDADRLIHINEINAVRHEAAIVSTRIDILEESGFRCEAPMFAHKRDTGLQLRNVRFGSKADIGTQSRNVRFVPKADIRPRVLSP